MWTICKGNIAFEEYKIQIYHKLSPKIGFCEFNSNYYFSYYSCCFYCYHSNIKISNPLFENYSFPLKMSSSMTLIYDFIENLDSF